MRLLPAREQALARVAVDDGRQLVDDLGLLLRERARHVYREPVVDVAAAAAAQLRRPLAPQALDRAVLGAGRYADPLRTGERRRLDRGAANRLRNRDRYLDLEVVALAGEDRRVGHVCDDVEVARGAAARPGLALAGEPDAAALAHPGWDVHAVALDLARAAGAVAGRAGILDLGAGAAALAAGLRD